MIPAIGNIVAYHHNPAFDSFSGDRPAIIVRAWGNPPRADSVVQMQVFVDGSNDGVQGGLVWKTSCLQGTLPGQWSELPAGVAL